MAQNKKSVLLYCDIIHTVEKLDDETAGKLFKHYLRYINDQDPEAENLLIEVSFEPIKQNLKRDLKKWESRAERSRINGALGGRPKNPKEPRKPSGLNNNPSEPRKPVKDNVTVTVKDNVRDIDIIKKEFKEQIKEFATLYNDEAELNKFYEYWTEKSLRGKKMRFEKEKVFDVQRRLKTWFNNKKEWKKDKPAAPKTAAQAFKEKLLNQ